MTEQKNKVFISYHHGNDQGYKDDLLKLNEEHDLFIDKSVDTGDISDDLSDQTIRRKIRDDYLRDSTVTILLVGTETQNRKHVDWEVFSSMIDGEKNKKSGVLVISLPSTGCTTSTAAHGEEEKATVYPDCQKWTTIDTEAEYKDRYPYLPARIIDNLLKKGAKVSVTNWERVKNDVDKLRFLINATCDDRAECDYDLSRPMRRRNS